MNRCADESGCRLLGSVLESFLLKLLDSGEAKGSKLLCVRLNHARTVQNSLQCFSPQQLLN